VDETHPCTIGDSEVKGTIQKTRRSEEKKQKGTRHRRHFGIANRDDERRKKENSGVSGAALLSQKLSLEKRTK